MRIGICEVSGRTWGHHGRGPVARLHPDLRQEWYQGGSLKRARKSNAKVAARKAAKIAAANEAAGYWANFKAWPTDSSVWISDTGDVWLSDKGRFANIRMDYKGYEYFNRGGRNHFVHSALLETYVGPRPKDAITRHMNGVKRDNKLSNLEWSTFSQNSLDVKWNGKAKHIKLYPNDVREVRKAFEAGETKMAIARRYGVDAASIYKIIAGMTHADVS